MGKSGERTPITIRAHMTEVQRRSAKAVAALRQMYVREFWEEAMESHLEARKAAGDDFSYDFVPRDAESLSVYADEGLVAEVDEWAEKDNVRKDDALYTAFSRHIEVWAQKLMR